MFAKKWGFRQASCKAFLTLSERSNPDFLSFYLPEQWTSDWRRRGQAGVPAELGFLTKPEIALRQITAAVEQGVPGGVMLADAAYCIDSKFRNGPEVLGLQYMLGIQSTTTIWPADSGPL